MAIEKSQRMFVFIAVGKDLVALLRDACLFLLVVLLIVFPKTFNSVLEQAGFEEGGIVGFKWKSQLVDSDTALKAAKGALADLQKKNDAAVRALADANAKLADPVFKERFAKLEEANTQSKVAAQQVQFSVARTIDSNVPFIRKAMSSVSSAVPASR
ncbi:hypothetical protein ACQUKI_16145 [Ralstonia pseudosolanacearum]